jgi:opacity protein-like surface antigen
MNTGISMRGLSIVIILACISTPLRAQDAGSIGLTLGLGGRASIGAIYHPWKSFALRPMVGYTENTGEASDERDLPSSYSNESTTQSYFVGLNAQYYLDVIENLSSYVGAGGSYSLGKFESTSRYHSQTQDTEVTRTSTTKGVGATAYFGLQYALSKRFNVYGELGAWYTWTTYRRDDAPNQKQSATGLSLSTSALGVIFYLN